MVVWLLTGFKYNGADADVVGGETLTVKPCCAVVVSAPEPVTVIVALPV